MKPSTYANQYTPQELRSQIPRTLEQVISTQRSLVIKKVLSLYFSQTAEAPMIYDQGIKVNGDYITIPSKLLSEKTTDTTSYSLDIEAFQRFQSEIESSVKFDSSELEGAKGLISNYCYITPEQDEQLRGQRGVRNTKSIIVNLLQEVSIQPGQLTVRVSSFTKEVRDYTIKKLNEAKNGYDRDWIITANTHHILRFKSAHALQFYYLIARVQQESNQLEISLTELASVLNLTYTGSKANELLRRTIRRITEDAALKESTCALIAKTVRNKTVYYEAARRDKSGITHFRFHFKRNDELKYDLLNKEYPFIQHLKDSLNESILVQIIARVDDKIIEERWVNYCINKAYEYRSENPGMAKKYNGIGPLVWEYIKAKASITQYQHEPLGCQLSPSIGISMWEYSRMKNTQVSLIDVPAQEGEGKNTVTLMHWMRSQTSLSPDLIQYAATFMGEDQIHKALAFKSKAQRYDDFLTALILEDFKSKFKDEIKVALRSVGFAEKKSNILIKLLPTDELSTFFSYRDHNGGRTIRIPENVRRTIFEHLNLILEGLKED